MGEKGGGSSGLGIIGVWRVWFGHRDTIICMVRAVGPCLWFGNKRRAARRPPFPPAAVWPGLALNPHPPTKPQHPNTPTPEPQHPPTDQHPNKLTRTTHSYRMGAAKGVRSETLGRITEAEARTTPVAQLSAFLRTQVRYSLYLAVGVWVGWEEGGGRVHIALDLVRRLDRRKAKDGPDPLSIFPPHLHLSKPQTIPKKQPQTKKRWPRPWACAAWPPPSPSRTAPPSTATSAPASWASASSSPPSCGPARPSPSYRCLFSCELWEGGSSVCFGSVSYRDTYSLTYLHPTSLSISLPYHPIHPSSGPPRRGTPLPSPPPATPASPSGTHARTHNA